ncbi:hypothetical protein P43SY_011445 [Pythium insidiosum]|uniref:Uncharacterized protein n=1 Tax=Pythium insidiosum TaxID=114742 RepID=A0AAD5Q2Y6_PYTIN|nr:hypothetical protein P43SY_011445 [Pythium insidiosum]
MNQPSELLSSRDATVLASSGKRKSFDKARSRRTTSNATLRAHQTVSKKEEMFGAAASAISERFVVNGERLRPRKSERAA